MGVLRCTSKYRKALGLPERLGEPLPRPTNALGEWYANTLNVGALRLLHYHSSGSRLSVIVPLSPRKTAEARFVAALDELLGQLGASAAQKDQEIGALLPFTYGRATDRSVLSTLRDHGHGVKWDLHFGHAHSPTQLTWRLAETPCGPLNGRSPDAVTLELLRDAFEHSRLVG